MLHGFVAYYFGFLYTLSMTGHSIYVLMLAVEMVNVSLYFLPNSIKYLVQI